LEQLGLDLVGDEVEQSGGEGEGRQDDQRLAQVLLRLDYRLRVDFIKPIYRQNLKGQFVNVTFSGFKGILESKINVHNCQTNPYRRQNLPEKFSTKIGDF
jgi:hypothetical protein